MKESQQDMQEVLAGRPQFFAMAATYFLGVFNDNFFKQAALLLAVTAGLSGLQGKATMLFSLPFILFSAYGGWLADRFPKRRVIIGVKILEVIAMMMGAYGILTLSWTWILAMVALMGLQSTFFGPALNGSIPELYPTWYITKANAVLKLITTSAILLGIAVAGIALDQRWLQTEIPFGRILVAAVVLFVSFTGVVTAFRIKKVECAQRQIPFPWSGPLVSLRDSMGLYRDPLLLLAVVGDTFFYFFSLLAIMVINTMGISELHMSATATSLLAVALMVGVCIGALVAAQITTPGHWTQVLAPASFGMGISLFATGTVAGLDVSFQWLLLLMSLGGAGICGGIFLIPFTAFIQVRPKDDEKGRIISAANFCAFSGMLIAGQFFSTFDRLFIPSTNMLFLGGLGVVAAVLFLAGARVANHYDKSMPNGEEL